MLVKLLYWDLLTKHGRLEWYNMVLRHMPGSFGVSLRGKFLRRYFGKLGKDPVIYQEVMYRNIQKIYAGDNFNIGTGSFIQAAGGLRAGDRVMLGPFVRIWTANHSYKDPTRPIMGQGYEFKEVFLDDDVWIGANSFIMPGVTLGAKCIVSAGSVVSAKKYPPGTILGGNPARKIGEVGAERDGGAQRNG